MRLSRREFRLRNRLRNRVPDAPSTRRPKICSAHGIDYQWKTSLADGRPMPWCPHCNEDDRWMAAALEQQRVHGQALNYDTALPIAEQLAGHELKLFRHGR